MNRRKRARSLGGVDDLRDLLRVGGGRCVARAYFPDLSAETLGHPPLRLRCTIRWHSSLRYYSTLARYSSRYRCRS
jgi:hypothetical protein